MSCGPFFIALAIAGLIWAIDRRLTRLAAATAEGVDRAYALCAHRAGAPDETIAIELGRPAHQVRDWLETDLADRGAA